MGRKTSSWRETIGPDEEEMPDTGSWSKSDAFV
jgi:hypothetical protein